MESKIQDKLLFPLGSNIEEAKRMLQNTDIKQFYTGVANSVFGGCSISHHYSPAGCFKREEICELLKIAKGMGKKITLTFNVAFYSPFLEKYILEDVEYLIKYPIEHIVVANLQIYELLLKHFPNLKYSASSLFGIKSTEAAEYFYNLGFDKIILPRNIKVSEVIKIAQKFSKVINIETFVYGGGCTYCEGTCQLPHVYLGNTTHNLAKDVGFISPTPICKFPVELYSHEDFQGIRNISFGFRGCGLCYIKSFDELGISTFKVTGRTMSAQNRKKLLMDIPQVSKMDISECSFTKEHCLYEKEEII